MLYWTYNYCSSNYCAGEVGEKQITLTHNEAIMSTIVTIEEAVTSLEEEKAALCMVVIGCDAKHTETLPLAKELLLPRVYTMLGSCLWIIAGWLFIACCNLIDKLQGVPKVSIHWENELTKLTKCFPKGSC